MNEITPPPDGWPVLVVLMVLAMLLSSKFGGKFWKAVQIVAIVSLVIVLWIGLSQ